MISASDRVVRILRDFEAKIQWAKSHQQNSGILNEINFQIDVVVEQFRFLTVFEDCIHKWSDADFDGFLSIKIKATVQNITNEVLGEVFLNFGKELEEMEEYSESFQERASRMLLLFIKFEEKIDLLKPEIEEVIKGLSVQYFRCHSPMFDLAEWESFVSSLLAFLVKVEDQYNSGDSRRKQAQDMYHILYSLRSLLCGFSMTLRDQDFSIHVVEVSLRAALVCCHWWSRQFCPNLKDDVSSAFADLRKRIIFTDLDQILRRLKPAYATLINFSYTYYYMPKGEEVTIFVHYLLPFRRRFENFSGKRFWENKHLMPFRFIRELESLTISMVKDLKISEEDFKKDGSFFQDFKLLILDAEECFCNCLTENGTLMLNLLEKVWLMKMEIFLLTAADDFKLFNQLQMDPLIEGVRQILSSSAEIRTQTLPLLEDVVKLVAAVHEAFQGRNISRDMVRAMLLLLLIKIRLFKLDRKIQDYNESSALFRDRMETYLEGSKFLINCLINQQEGLGKEGELGLARVETMARRVITFCYSITSSNIDEQMVQNINLMLSDSEDEVKFVMAKLRETYLPVPISNFPKNNALGFYDALLTKLRELLVFFKDNFFEFVKQYIVEILEYLEFFRDCLGDILKLAEEIQELRSLGNHVINVAYEAEYVVDLIVVREKSAHNLIWLYHLLQNIRHIKMQVTEATDIKTYGAEVHNLPHISGHVVSKTATRRMDDIMLCLNDQQELIIDRLVGGYPQLEIVAIVGMPGIGKTTIAKQVYYCPTVAHQFHVRAWCCVTAVYRKRELLLEILSHIVAITNNIHQMSNEDLDLKLHQLLLRRKYLIVIDDIWSNEAWNDLRRSFPDNENGSRVLITSRLNDVVLNEKYHFKPVELRLLSDKESWYLLQLKIFGNDSCPMELIEVGQRIAKSCRGLPLAIVAMAGLLERTEKKQNKWMKIEETLISRIVNDPLEQCHKMLELSYKLLPDHLKACFLYFGAFLEDQEISVTKLIRLWIAEGFVQKNDLKGLEDLAEDYLKDLIGRSLVIFARPRSLGGTKACRVHDMLRNLCLSKAKEDNFLQVITRSNESSFDDLDFVINVNSTNSSDCQTYECPRLSFYSTRNNFTEMKPSGPLVRSLLFFATNNKYARSSYDISFISYSFRLLKVLDLESINMGPSFPNGIELMLHLRYLAVSGDIEFVPSSIANLSNLETFIVKGLKGKVKIPDGIWHLKRLRHIHVSDVAFFYPLDDGDGNFSLLDYLVTLSSPLLGHDEHTKSMLKKCPNLRKMACIFSESSNGDGTCNIFPRLDVLSHLESLRITYYGRYLQTAEFSFPFSLKKLTLSNFCLSWKHISVIGRLPNLQVLKLLSRSCDGEVWNMVEGEFCNLKFLKLDTLNLAQWNASCDNLPCLQQLVLRNCKHLEEVPYSFMEIPTLQMIEVQWCSKSAEESVRRMREEADEWLRVVIFSDLDLK